MDSREKPLCSLNSSTRLWTKTAAFCSRGPLDVLFKLTLKPAAEMGPGPEALLTHGLFLGKKKYPDDAFEMFPSALYLYIRLL